MSTEISTELITHKLILKGEGIKYIHKKLAENIFTQLADQNNKTITIVNPNTLLYLTKYRSEVSLIPLDEENKNIEDKLYLAWLKEDQKEKFRKIWSQRKKEWKTTGEISFKEVVEAVKKNKI